MEVLQATPDDDLLIPLGTAFQTLAMVADHAVGEMVRAMSSRWLMSDVENRVIAAIKTKLTDPDLLKIYEEEYVKERQSRSLALNAARPMLEKRAAELRFKIERLTEHLCSNELTHAAAAFMRQHLTGAPANCQLQNWNLADCRRTTRIVLV
jgi:uncharacterized protein YqeY